MEKFDVIVVGGGPVGTVTTQLLGQRGVKVLVLEREAELTPFPRAVVLDDESMRTLQTVGIADALCPNLVQNPPLRYYSGKGRLLVDIAPRESTSGWPVRNMFLQPQLESMLRETLSQQSTVTLRNGAEVTELTQDDTGVTVTLRDTTTGLEERCEASYVVGADGGRSTVRHLVGVTMIGSTYESRWLVVEATNSTVHAPYSALHCRSERPYYTGHLPHGFRRWEFMVLPGETEEDVVSPDGLRRLLGPVVPDFDTLELTQPRVYTHHTRIADQWVVGRVMLTGDAAHLMPPWAGQGLNSGLRDAANLAWKLSIAVQGGAPLSLLATYHDERYDHAQAMITLSHRLGAIFTPRNKIVASARDAALVGLQWLPVVRGYVRQMRFKSAPLLSGPLVIESPGAVAGRWVPQPRVEVEGVQIRLDDIVGYEFALIFRDEASFQGMGERTRILWEKTGARFVVVSSDTADAEPDPHYVAVGDGDMTLRQWFERAASDVAVVRPDRYVAAACPVAELDGVTERLAEQL